MLTCVQRPFDFIRAWRPLDPGFSPFGSVCREAPFGTGRLGRALERAISADPFFKSRVERALGGIIIPDGRADGRLALYRPPFSTVGDILRHTVRAPLLAAGGMASALAGINLGVATGALAGSLARLAGNIASFSSGGVAAAGSADWRSQVGPEAAKLAQGMGVNLDNASFEDVLFLLLMKYAKDKENDILDKVKELDKALKEAEDKKKEGGKGKGKGLLNPLGIFGGKGKGKGGGGGKNVTGTDFSGADLGKKMDVSQMSDTMKQQMLQKLMGDLQKLYEML